MFGATLDAIANEWRSAGAAASRTDAAVCTSEPVTRNGSDVSRVPQSLICYFCVLRYASMVDVWQPLYGTATEGGIRSRSFVERVAGSFFRDQPEV